MSRHIFGLLLSGALITVPVTSFAQASFSLAAGASAPVSDLGNIADIGYNLAAGLELGAFALPVGARIELGYNGFGFKNGGGDVRIISGTANAIFNLGVTRDAPYLIGGVGVYNRNYSSNNFGYGSGSYGTGSTAVGINGGGGLRFPLSGLSTYFEARYHIMLGNSADGTNYQFIPITFGVTF